MLYWSNFSEQKQQHSNWSILPRSHFPGSNPLLIGDHLRLGHFLQHNDVQGGCDEIAKRCAPTIFISQKPHRELWNHSPVRRCFVGRKSTLRHPLCTFRHLARTLRATQQPMVNRGHVELRKQFSPQLKITLSWKPKDLHFYDYKLLRGKSHSRLQEISELSLNLYSASSPQKHNIPAYLVVAPPNCHKARTALNEQQKWTQLVADRFSFGSRKAVIVCWLAGLGFAGITTTTLSASVVDRLTIGRFGVWGWQISAKPTNRRPKVTCRLQLFTFGHPVRLRHTSPTIMYLLTARASSSVQNKATNSSSSYSQTHWSNKICRVAQQVSSLFCLASEIEVADERAHVTSPRIGSTDKW